MNIQYHPNKEIVLQAIAIDEPLLVLVSHDGERIICANVEDSGEHSTLLRLAGHSELDIDSYFRLAVDKSGADWTFVCPSEYKGIADKSKRIRQFYMDGFAVIPKALNELGYMCGINIPTRYRRHVDMM